MFSLLFIITPGLQDGIVVTTTIEIPILLVDFKKADGQLQEAVRVLKKITFIPGKINGKAIKTFVAFPVSF